MANTVTITLTINTKIIDFGATLAIAAFNSGLPILFAFMILRAFAWVKISHSTEPSWKGWSWVGRNMRLTDG